MGNHTKSVYPFGTRLMAFLIKSIQAGKDQFGKPDVHHMQFMNFIR